MQSVSDKVIGRLARYRALLIERDAAGATYLFSHEIAAAMRLSDSQVRRDLMAIGTRGLPSRGYEVHGLLQDLDEALNQSRVHGVAVVGAGNLGRALIATLESSRTNLRIRCAFDSDKGKCNRVYSGVKCYTLDALDEVVAREGITLAILCVPAGAAQTVAERMVHAGVQGILNFSSAALRLPRTIALEEIDIANYLAKLAYFTVHPSKERRNGRHEER
ncbi:MAG: redox-sensing transcriptional repressor Rex [Holophaga sp.]|nr:redox-sensing transcriptional repressor Rex [Holophaga sp.]